MLKIACFTHRTQMLINETSNVQRLFIYGFQTKMVLYQLYWEGFVQFDVLISNS